MLRLCLAERTCGRYALLAQRNPGAFQPDLAGSIHNLGGMLSLLGRHEEALKATGEAVELRRVLAQRTPEAFQPDLATSLYNLGNRLSELDLREEALNAMQEAADKLWPFFERLPSAFARHTGAMLNGLRELHESLGRPLPLEIQERIDTFERLTKS
jgi:tetratricopeptide (TPR) repeat protein